MSLVDFVKMASRDFEDRRIDTFSAERWRCVSGDRKAEDPIEYDNLHPVMTGDTVVTAVFNRMIALFMKKDKQIRRMHRVLRKHDALGKD